MDVTTVAEPVTPAQTSLLIEMKRKMRKRKQFCLHYILLVGFIIVLSLRGIARIATGERKQRRKKQRGK